MHSIDQTKFFLHNLMFLEFLFWNKYLINKNTKILGKTSNTHPLYKQSTLQSPGARIEM